MANRNKTFFYWMKPRQTVEISLPLSIHQSPVPIIMLSQRPWETSSHQAMNGWRGNCHSTSHSVFGVWTQKPLSDLIVFPSLMDFFLSFENRYPKNRCSRIEVRITNLLESSLGRRVDNFVSFTGYQRPNDQQSLSTNMLLHGMDACEINYLLDLDAYEYIYEIDWGWWDGIVGSVDLSWHGMSTWVMNCHLS